jgi:cobalamin synthase
VNPEHEHTRSDERSAFWLAGGLLLPIGVGEAADNPRWRSAAVWLPIWGLLIGAAYAGLFRPLWLWLGEYQQIRLAPMAVLLAFDVAWLGYRPLAGAAAAVAGWPDRNGSTNGLLTLQVVVFVALAVIVKFALLVALPAGGGVTWPADWRANLRFLYPYVIFRPLVLMPLWGRWAVLMAANIGRVSPDGSGRLRAMASGSKMSGVMIYWLVITALTILYCSPSIRHVGWPVLISLGMLVAAYLASFVLARRFGGQTEATVMATGWAVEIAFLLAYLPLARYIHWY